MLLINVRNGQYLVGIVFKNKEIHIKKNVFQVFDTWAKLQSGVLRGNLVNPGGFTDCVNFRHFDATQLATFQGQYCMVRYSASLEENNLNNENGFDWREM